MNKWNKLKRKTSPLALPRKGNTEEDNISGFGLKKIIDRNSIFCGLPSLNRVSTYVDTAIEHWHLIPTKNDSKIVTRIKLASLVWRIVRAGTWDNKIGTIVDRTDLNEIEFGVSSEIIGELVDEVIEPDEMFRPQGNGAFAPQFDLYRYSMNDEYLYWIMEKDSVITKKILVTDGITKDNVLEMLWTGLGRIIQLESDNDGLTYVKTELTQKKIYGSSNDLIAKLQEDYRYFRENKLSRGYLLIGKPGTGKTAIINSIVENAEGRVFIISGLNSPSNIEEMESLFIQMKPDFIIFDDCDRSQSSPVFIKAVLKMLETVKDKNPHTNLLFTANTFSGILYDEAVTRKGRIDQIYEVPEPCVEDRVEIFKEYSKEMKVDLSDEDLEKCVQSSDGMTGADIKELCIQLQRATIDEVFERAKEIENLRDKYSGDDYDEDSLLDSALKRKLQRLATRAR